MQKLCEVCGDPFEPDPRVGDRQRVCSKPGCKQERKRRSQHCWLSGNSGYFEGRYPNTKAWLAAHPDYLKTYRAGRKQLSLLKSSRDIQDKLTVNENNMLTPLKQALDIQDELSSRLSKSKQCLHQAMGMIYKTSELTVNKSLNHS